MFSHLLYNAFIRIYGLTIWCFSLFNPKAAMFIRGRRHVYGRLVSLSYSRFSSIVWIHASSLGEFEQARPIIEGLRARTELLGVVVTFFSPSGYDVRKDYGYADLVTYLPLDTPKNARKFLRLLKPDVAIFIKYDFWYNHLSECVKQGVKVVYASAVLRERMVQFNRARGMYLPLFRKFDKFFVQDDRSKQLLEKHKVFNAEVTGDTRFDQVQRTSSQRYEDPVVEAFCSGYEIVIFGSAWPSDLEVIRGMIDHFHQFKFIVAPHNVEEKIVEEIRSGLHTKSVRYTDIATPQVIQQRAMVIDNVGLLSRLYRYAKYAYVGGAFQGGLHNTLEPAAYGIPVFFGEHPSNFKFLEAMGLIECGGGFEVSDARSMIQLVTKMEEDPKNYRVNAGASREYIVKHTGGTERVLQYLLQQCIPPVQS